MPWKLHDFKLAEVTEVAPSPKLEVADDAGRATKLHTEFFRCTSKDVQHASLSFEQACFAHILVVLIVTHVSQERANVTAEGKRTSYQPKAPSLALDAHMLHAALLLLSRSNGWRPGKKSGGSRVADKTDY